MNTPTAIYYQKNPGFICVSTYEALEFVEEALAAIQYIETLVKAGINIRESKRSFWKRFSGKERKKDIKTLNHIEFVKETFITFRNGALFNQTGVIEISPEVWESGHSWVKERFELNVSNKSGVYR